MNIKESLEGILEQQIHSIYTSLTVKENALIFFYHKFEKRLQSHTKLNKTLEFTDCPSILNAT